MKVREELPEKKLICFEVGVLGFFVRVFLVF